MRKRGESTDSANFQAIWPISTTNEFVSPLRHQSNIKAARCAVFLFYWNSWLKFTFTPSLFVSHNLITTHLMFSKFSKMGFTDPESETFARCKAHLLAAL